MNDDSAEGTSLAPLTTLGLGGPAHRLVTATSTEDILAGVCEVARGNEPLLLLAGGSNVVIGDDGFPGTVLLVRSKGWDVTARAEHSVDVLVQAGQPWDEFVAATVAQGWSGVECLSGIPGAAGATPIQNVGAYGQEVAHTIIAVTAYDRDEGLTRVFSRDECRFGYRTSLFKYSDRWVVLDVTFRLGMTDAIVNYTELAKLLGVETGQRVSLAAARAAVLELRRGKGMVIDPSDPDTRSVGSFFTNPVLAASAYQKVLDLDPPWWPMADGLVKVSAAWLIEKAGFSKGYRRGPVAISSKHTLALINPGDGTTEELLALAAEIRDGVHDRFGVSLHPEPVMVNCDW